MCHDAGAPATTVLNNRQALKSQVAPTDGGVIPIKAHLKSSQMEGQPYSHPRRIFTLARLRSAALCARALSVVHRASVRSTRTPHRLRTRNRSSLFRCFPPWCPASTPAPSEHMRLPCLPHDCGFVRVPFFTVARRRRPDADLPPICLPPLHPARFTARDCPILRPRAGLPLSRD